MGYYIVSVVNGLADIDYNYFSKGFSVSETACYVELRPGYTIKETWTEITEEQFNTAKANMNEPPA